MVVRCVLKVSRGLFTDVLSLRTGCRSDHPLALQMVIGLCHEYILIIYRYVLLADLSPTAVAAQQLLWLRETSALRGIKDAALTLFFLKRLCLPQPLPPPSQNISKDSTQTTVQVIYAR